MLRLKSPPNFEINYLQADVNYTIFHLHDGKKIMSSFTLKKFEHDSRLSTFPRDNKSILLNPNFVQKLKKKASKQPSSCKTAPPCKYREESGICWRGLGMGNG